MTFDHSRYRLCPERPIPSCSLVPGVSVPLRTRFVNPGLAVFYCIASGVILFYLPCSLPTRVAASCGVFEVFDPMYLILGTFYVMYIYSLLIFVRNRPLVKPPFLTRPIRLPEEVGNVRLILLPAGSEVWAASATSSEITVRMETKSKRSRSFSKPWRVQLPGRY
ncbi:hypothetical protein BJX76DRAFT_28968 [Aspergillus varians]